MNPIRFPLFHNSQEAMLNCLLIRPLWHDRDRRVRAHTQAHAGVHIYMYTQGHANIHSQRQTCTNTHTHTSIYTSNLLVMRSVLSLELREKREDMKERRKRDERRGGQQRKSHVMFPSGGQGVCVCVCVCNWSFHLHLLQGTFLCVLHADFCVHCISKQQFKMD